MKKIVLLIFIFLAYAEGFSQEIFKLKKGYIGISIGPAIHTGSPQGFLSVIPLPSIGENDPVEYQVPESPGLSAGDVGLTINLIDAGYTFGKNWGIAFKWQGGAFIDEVNNESLLSNFGMIMLGPMYSIQLKEDLILDLKFRAGRMYFGQTIENENGVTSEYRSFNLGLEGGGTLRYHFAPKWSWINNIEFQNQFSEFSDVRINRINLSSGVAFRF